MFDYLLNVIEAKIKKDTNSVLEGKFYRVSYNGEGVYEALRKKIGWDWKNVKQDPDINWLPNPNIEYKDYYRSFFTTLGYNTFKSKTMKIIDKYLDSKKIEVKEYNGLEGIIIYQDQYQVVLNNEKYINENSLIKRNFYHGAIEKFDVLKPYSFNGGHRFRNSSWSVFLWAQHSLAYQWGLFLAVETLCVDHKLSYPVFRYEKRGLNEYTMKIGIKKQDYDIIKKVVDKEKVKFYVYTAQVNVTDSKLGLGTNSQQPEYTYDGELKPSKTEEYILTSKNFKEIHSLDDDTYDDWKTNRPNMKGFLAPLYTKESLQKWGYVRDRMNDGTLKPGDDHRMIDRDFEKAKRNQITESSDFDNNLVFSENDIYLNWDKWITGKSHVLFVDGLSGSGKSTIAKKMANQYDASYVEIDVIAFKIVGEKAINKNHNNFDYIRKQDPFLWKYMHVKHISPNFLTHLSVDDDFRHTDEEEEYKRQEIDKYIHWLCFEQKERVVIEGGHAGVTLTRNPELYKDFPIIFKGTSLAKSVLRRIVRAGKKGTFYTPLRWLNVIKVQYMEHMYPEVNDARRKMLTGREDDILYVKEGADFSGMVDFSINDKETLHKKSNEKIKVPSGIKDFKDFCNRITSPEMSMKWFIKNKIKWTPNGGDNDHPFQWPDYLIKQKMGNCFDQTIFMHYYCRKKKLDHRMYLVTWLGDNNTGTGHAVPLYKKGKYVYIWIYLRPGVGQIGGPFRSFEEAKSVLDKYFLVAINRILKAPTTPYSSFLSQEDMDRFDEYYGDRKITQTEYITNDFGVNMRSSHLFKLKFKGFIFPNPALPVYDVVTTVVELLKFSRYLIPSNVDESVEIYISNEGTTMVKDKYGNWKPRSKSTYVDMDDNADEKEYLKRVEFIKLKDDRYSSEPQPVIYYGKDDYRARCEVLIIKGSKVLLDRGKDRAGMGYSLPGGGIDPRESIAKGAARECEEEAMIIPKHIQYMNIAWREEFPKPKLYNTGAISFVCVAEYGKYYKGNVDDEDKDEFADRAKWEEIEEANLSEPHMLAIKRYFNGSLGFNESAYTDSKRLKKIADTPEELNKLLNKCPYGAVDFSGKVIPNGMENNNIEELYRTQSPKLFEENGYCGNCWDYTIFIYQYFKSFFKEYSINAYYIQVDDGEYQPTHTWLTYSKKNDKSGSVYIFESAWKPFSGIKLFKSEKESIDYYKALHLNYVRSNGANIHGSFILRFIPEKGCWGRNFTEFMAYVIQHSQWITGDSYLKKKYDVANKHLLSSEMEQLQGIQKMRT